MVFSQGSDFSSAATGWKNVGPVPLAEMSKLTSGEHVTKTTYLVEISCTNDFPGTRLFPLHQCMSREGRVCFGGAHWPSLPGKVG